MNLFLNTYKEMKAKELTIGSVIYILNKNSFSDLIGKDYKTNENVVKHIIKKITITNIQLKDSRHLINESYSSYGGTRFELTIEKSELDKSIIKRENDTYFFNKDDYYQLIREGVVNYLDNIKKRIKDFEMEQEEKYRSIQKHYWNFLQ